MLAEKSTGFLYKDTNAQGVARAMARLCTQTETIQQEKCNACACAHLLICFLYYSLVIVRIKLSIS